MNQGTTTTLIEDLELIDTKSNNEIVKGAIKKVIDRAKASDYHDFKSELPAPKMMLFRDLSLIGLDDLAQKAINGLYDELD